MKVKLIEHRNPFDPSEHEVHLELMGQSIRDVLEAWSPGFERFSGPTLVLLNGSPVLRDDWLTPLVGEDDIISLISLPAASALVYIFYAVVIVSIAYSIQMASKVPKLSNPSDPPVADPVYSIGASKNTQKLGQPVEAVYGRHRLYPSYASRPFNRYLDGEQYLYQLFCLGQGSFDVEGVYIEDTLITNFREVSYEVYPPGHQTTLFPDNVITAPEVSNLELFGTNQSQHTTYGPYTLNHEGSLATRVEIDLVMPNGLYLLNDDGDPVNLGISARFEIRQVDDLGEPITDWTHFASPSYSYRSPNPLRFTIGLDVVPGRYQIRGLRTNSKNNSSRASNVIYWESARAFLPSTRDYGDVTMLAVAMKATNNLNDNSQNRVNLICTRKIPVWNGSKWTTQASRSAMWALADIVMSKYGSSLPQQSLDLPKMLAIDQLLASRGDYFDYVFNQKTTIWQAMSTACQVGRCEPLALGPRFSITRDEPKTIPIGVFAVDNILKDSLEWDIEYFDPTDPDSVEVSYVDPISWRDMVVLCIPPGSTGTRPRKIKLAGCHSRDQAYREGMFRALASEKRRENITFTTGLEGIIPTRGSLVAVSYDLPNWGFSGCLVDVGLDNVTLYLDNDLPWSPGVTHNLLLRLDDGSGLGPILVTQGESKNIAIASQPIDMGRFSKSLGRDPIMFLFGPVDKVFKRCLVREVKPQGGEKVSLTVVNEDNSVFEFDNATAPPVSGSSVPPKVPDLPEVRFIQANPIPGNLRQVLVVWGVALGAKYYYLQQSLDGVSWQGVVTTAGTSFPLEVSEGELFLRVSAINVGAGEWATWNGIVGVAMSAPSPVTGLALSYAFTGFQASLEWYSVYEAEFYRVRVYDSTDTLLMTRTSTLPQFTLDYNDVNSSDAIRRTYKISVWGVNHLGESGVPATLTITNEKPSKITTLGSVAIGETDSHVNYRGSWSTVPGVDIRAYAVWGSTDPNFVPSDSNKVFEGLSTAIDISVPKSNGLAPVYYWYAAALDLWGTDYTLSDRQQTIPI